MEIAFFQFASSSIHFAASLEILRKNDSMGNRIFYNIWGAKTKYPGRMSINFESISGKTPRKNLDLIRRASSKTSISEKLVFDSEWVLQKKIGLMKQIDSLKNISEFKSLSFEGINPGPALANEITTITKNRNIELDKINQTLALLVESYLEVYNATQKFLKTNKIDEVVLFNGRFLHERGVWDATRDSKIPILLFETTRNRYFESAKGFHNRSANQKVMLKHWNDSKQRLSDKIDIGSKYFNDLRSNLNQYSSLSDDFGEIKSPYFVFFSSSDDEAVGFWEEWNEPLGDQLACIRKLQDIFDRQEKYRLIIRIHPNLVNKSRAVIAQWDKLLDSKSTLVIRAEQKISSYEVLNGAIGVISFGSTIGLESVFAEKPSAVLADCGYDELGVVDKPLTWIEVERWIQEIDKIEYGVLSDRKQKSCVRGYYLATGGYPFLFTVLKEIGWGAWVATAFMGKKFNEPKGLILLRRGLSKYKFYKVRKIMVNG